MKTKKEFRPITPDDKSRLRQIFNQDHLWIKGLDETKGHLIEVAIYGALNRVRISQILSYMESIGIVLEEKDFEAVHGYTQKIRRAMESLETSIKLQELIENTGVSGAN